jgi:hypothetical protein
MSELGSFAGLLVGRTICSARFVGPFVGDAGGVEDVREVSDLELDLGGLFLRLSWQMTGTDERLAWELGSDSGVDAASEISQLGGWHGLIGSSISAVRSSLHVSDDSLPAAVWSVSLEVPEGGSLTVALGEIGSGDVPVYVPDSLCLIFDRTEALGYHPPASEYSAWGVEVSPVR